MRIRYLLYGGVADGVRVVMVVDDFKVSDGLSLGRPGEVDLRLGLACSLGVYGEVGRFAHLHAWKDLHRTCMY